MSVSARLVRKRQKTATRGPRTCQSCRDGVFNTLKCAGMGRQPNHSLVALHWDGSLRENLSTATPSAPWESSEPFVLWHPGQAYVIRGVLTLMCLICGILFNTFIIVAIVSNRKLRSVRNVFLAHLGVLGLASSCTTVLLSCVSLLRGSWVGGNALCQMYAYIFSVLFLISVWIITALSWDKYQTIANPLHHSQTASGIRMAIIFCIFWLAGITMSLPPFFGGNQFAFHPAMAMCSVQFSNSFGLWYSVSFLVSGTVIPLVILTYCYAHIFKIARTQSSKIAASMVKMVSIIQAPITTTPPRSISIKGKRAIGTILHIVGAFLITYIPFALVVTTEMIAQTITSDVLSAISGAFVLSAPVINGAVYGLRNRILRESFSTFVRKKYKRLVGHDHGLDNGLIPRASSHSLARRNSSNLRLSALIKRGPNDSPTSRPLSRTQSLRTRILTAPSSPAFMQIPNGLRPQQSCIPRVNSMPIQYMVDGDFTIL